MLSTRAQLGLDILLAYRALYLHDTPTVEITLSIGHYPVQYKNVYVQATLHFNPERHSVPVSGWVLDRVSNDAFDAYYRDCAAYCQTRGVTIMQQLDPLTMLSQKA